MKNIIVTLTAFTLFALSAPAQATDVKCALKMVADIPATIGSDGRFFIPVKLNKQQFDLAVDTGAQIPWLTEAAISKLRLTKKRAHRSVLMFNGFANSKVEVTSTQLGPIQAKDVEFLVKVSNALPVNYKGTPTGTYENVSVPPDMVGDTGRVSAGAIPIELLKLGNLTDLELSPTESRVRLFSQKHCPSQVVYWTNQYIDIAMHTQKALPLIKVKLNGQEFTASIETGTSESYITPDLAKRLGLRPEDEKLKKISDYNLRGIALHPTWKEKTYEAPLQSLEIGGIAFKNTTVRISEFWDSEIEVVLGMQHLKHLRLYFAFGEGKLYASAANATK